MNSIRVFPFFISFFCCNKMNNKSSIKEDTRKMENCKGIKASQILDRSSRPELLCRKSALKNFAKFNFWLVLLKERLRQRCFPVNFPKFLRTSFLIEHLKWLLLFRVNRVSDHYARSIYVKVFLWITVPWMLVP